MYITFSSNLGSDTVLTEAHRHVTTMNQEWITHKKALVLKCYRTIH